MVDAATGERVRKVADLTDGLAVAADPAGRRVYAIEAPGQTPSGATVAAADAADGKRAWVRRLSDRPGRHPRLSASLLVSRDGRWVAAACRAGGDEKVMPARPQVFAADGTPRAVLDTGGATDVHLLDFSADGRLIVGRARERDEASLRVWDASTGRPLRDWPARGGPVAAAFSPVGRTLAVLGHDRKRQGLDVVRPPRPEPPGPADYEAVVGLWELSPREK